MKRLAPVLLLAAASVAPASENLVPNAGFEGTGGWSTPSGHHPDKVAVDRTTAAQGGASLKLDGRGGRWFLDRWCHKVAIVPGRTYAVQVAIRRTTPAGYVGLDIVHTDAGGIQHTQSGFGRSPRHGVDRWEYFRGTFTFPAHYKNPQLALYSVKTGGVTWFDDIIIREIDKHDDPFALACRRAGSPPMIDGALSEWDGADAAVDSMVMGVSAVHAIRSPHPTRVRMMYDDRNLYVAAELDEPPGYTRKAACVGQDAPVWRDDCLELFLSPRVAGAVYVHVVVNAKGAIYDAYRSPGTFGVGGPTWNSGATVRTASDRRGWRVEMALPWSRLPGFAPRARGVFRVNFCRHMPFDNPARAVYSSWAWIGPSNDFHRPDVFQPVVFTDRPQRPARAVSNYRYLRAAGILANPDFTQQQPDGTPAFWVRQGKTLSQALDTSACSAGARFVLTAVVPGQPALEATLAYRTPDGTVKTVPAVFDNGPGRVRKAAVVVPDNAASLVRFSIACPEGVQPTHVQMTGARSRTFIYRQPQLYGFFVNKNPNVLAKDTAATLAIYPEAGLIRGMPSVFLFNSIQNFQKWIRGPMSFRVKDRHYRLELDLPDGIRIHSLGLYARGFTDPQAGKPQPSPRGKGYHRYTIPFRSLSHAGQLPLNLITDLAPGVKPRAYYHLVWDGGKQPTETFGIRVYEPIRVRAPKRFLAGLFVRLYHRNDTRRGSLMDDPTAGEFLETLHALGLNTILLDTPCLYRTEYFPEHDRFIRQVRDAGMEPAAMVAGRWSFRQQTRRDKAWAVDIHGKRDALMCPSYVGPAYQEMVATWAEVANHGIYFLDNDWEDWHGRDHLLCFCKRCIDTFRTWLKAHHPDLPFRDPHQFERSLGRHPKLHQAWREFKTWLAIRWHADVRQRMVEHMEARGVVRPGFPRICITQSQCMDFDWKRLADTAVNYISPMHYAYLDSLYAEPAIESCAARFLAYRRQLRLDRHKYLVTIAPGERDGRVLVPHKAMMYQVLEVAGSGAAGFKIWYQKIMNGGKYYWMARALRIIQPVEDILLDGTFAEVATDTPAARARAFTHADGTVLFVAHYGLSPTRVNVQVPLPPGCAVYDLDTRRVLPDLRQGQKTIPVTLDNTRVRLLLIATPSQWQRLAPSP